MFLLSSWVHLPFRFGIHFMSSFAHEVFSARTINGPSVKILNIQLIIQQFVAESDHGLRYDLNPK
jgi:hypothetical protein